MPVVRRFEFDVSFDAPHKPARPKLHEPEPPPPPPPPEPEFEPEPPPPPEPTFSQAELDAAYDRGVAAGHQAGEFEAMGRIERRLTDSIELLGYLLRESSADQKRELAAIERQATELSMLALTKLFPALLERAETRELEAMFTDVFETAIQEPRILVRAAPAMIDALEPRLRALAERAGFEGKLSVISDPRLEDTDCRAEWSEGGVERDPQRSLQAIVAAIEHGIAAFDQRNGLGRPAVASPLEEMT
jgi:flagellar assembly protein FliH